MKIYNNLFDIIEEIKRINPHYIFIDGGDDSGKSTLANKIAQELSFVHINLDDYLKKNRGFFVDFIKYELLKKMIENVSSPIIIEGICALAITKKLSIDHYIHIYIKKISAYGFWYDSEQYDINGDVEAFI